MASPLRSLTRFYEKVIAAAKTLPPPLFFAVIVPVTLIVGVIVMTLLGVNLQTNFFWLIAVVIVISLLGYLGLEYAGRSRATGIVPTPVSPPLAQRTIYDSAKSPSVGFDFKGRQSPIYGADGKPKTAVGLGELTFAEGGILNVRRDNTDGRFEILLERYSYLGTERDELPNNEVIAGKRKLQLTFEAKVSRGAKHTIKAVLKNESSGDWLGSSDAKVTDDHWTKFQLYLLADPSKSCRLRLDDMEVSQPSSIQIRKILFTEDASE
jgi:hypothetical protein